MPDQLLLSGQLLLSEALPGQHSVGQVVRRHLRLQGLAAPGLNSLGCTPACTNLNQISHTDITAAPLLTQLSRLRHLTASLPHTEQAIVGYYGPVGVAATACLANFYCEEGTERPMACPSGTQSTVLANDITSCVSSPGYYGPAGKFHAADQTIMMCSNRCCA